MHRPIDEADLRLITALRRHPRSSLVQLAEAADMARGTVYSRLDRLETEGVIVGYGPEIDPARAGFGVLAFTTLEIAQGSHDETTAALAAIPHVTEIHTVTGPGDLLCRIVAMSNDHLNDILQRIARIPMVGRSETHLSLSTDLRRTVADVIVNSTPTGS